MNQHKPLRLLAATLLIAAANGAAQAKDFDNLLRGDYAFSGEGSCLVSRGGFNRDLTPAGPPASFPFITSFSVQGVRTFNGDGTGKVVARVLVISHPFALPTSPALFNRGSASSSDILVDFTYEVASDRTITLDAVSFTGTTLTGNEAGQTFFVTNFPRFSGRISQDHRTLTIAHSEPTIETIQFSDGDIHHRICQRSRILLEQKD